MSPMGKCLMGNTHWVYVAMGICRMGICRLTIKLGHCLETHQGLYFGYPCMHKYQGRFGYCFPRETRLMPTWTVKPILNHITNHIDYRWARSGLFPLNLLCNPGASASLMKPKKKVFPY
jgi:hypothetical protein